MVCQGETFDFNGQVLSTSGTFFDTLTNAAMCDSFITLTLTVLEPIETMLNSTICDGEFVEFDEVMTVSYTHLTLPTIYSV